jgi:hypothetical protein
MNQAHGTEKIRDMIVDDIQAAQRHGDRPHTLTLLHVLHHFLKTYPELVLLNIRGADSMRAKRMPSPNQAPRSI